MFESNLLRRYGKCTYCKVALWKTVDSSTQWHSSSLSQAFGHDRQYKLHFIGSCSLNYKNKDTGGTSTQFYIYFILEVRTEEPVDYVAVCSNLKKKIKNNNASHLTGIFLSLYGIAHWF